MTFGFRNIFAWGLIFGVVLILSLPLFGRFSKLRDAVESKSDITFRLETLLDRQVIAETTKDRVETVSKSHMAVVKPATNTAEAELLLQTLISETLEDHNGVIQSVRHKTSSQLPIENSIFPVTLDVRWTASEAGFYGVLGDFMESESLLNIKSLTVQNQRRSENVSIKMEIGLLSKMPTQIP